MAWLPSLLSSPHLIMGHDSVITSYQAGCELCVPFSAGSSSVSLLPAEAAGATGDSGTLDKTASVPAFQSASDVEGKKIAQIKVYKIS